MFRYFLCLICLPLFAYAIVQTDLNGQWDWIKSYRGGEAGGWETPADLGYSMSMTIRNDSVYTFHGDTLKKSDSLTSILLQADRVELRSDTLILKSMLIEGEPASYWKKAFRATTFLVQGTITDSATGVPVGNVKVVLMRMAGEIEILIDSSRTGTTGSFSFESSDLHIGSLYIYTISDRYYYQSTGIDAIAAGDTITKNIKLKRIPTKASAVPQYNATQNIAVKIIKSQLRLSGLTANATVDIYAVNGRLLLRKVIPAGASCVRLPERIAASGRYQVSIRMNGQCIRKTILSL